MRKKCAGGCGLDALPGGKYHCRKGEPGYAACKQRAHRQRKTPGKTGNVTPVTPDFGALQDVISAGFERVVQKMAQSPADALIGTTSRSNDLQQEILDELRKMNAKIDALAGRPVVAMQAASDDTDLFDTIEVKTVSARSDVNPGENLINGMLRLAGKPEVKLDKPSGPKPLAGADVELAAPTFDDMEEIEL